MISGITGAHILLYSDNPEADRTFFRDVLGFGAVDAGGGWLILPCLLPRPGFTLPTVKNAVRSTVDVNFLARSSTSCATTCQRS